MSKTSIPHALWRHTARLFGLGLVTAGILILPACEPMTSHPYWDMPPFGADDVALYHGLQASCAQFDKQPAGKALGADKRFGTYGQWQSICHEAMAATPDQTTLILARLTEQVKMPGPGKFTGYYKPMLEASRIRTGEFTVPLLARPDDLSTCPNGETGQKHADGTCTSPYPARAEIEGHLERYHAIAWLKDPVDAFFLHIQGSGTLEVKDPANGQSQLVHIGFAGKNGHPYVSIGKVLRDMGELHDPITADDIRAWLKAHPDRANEVVWSNPSFIFFKETPEESVGAFGVQLVPGRSLAVDRSQIPLGLPVRVATRLTGSDEAFDRVMFAHDVGSAIKGPSRGDIYFGHGPAAGKVAGTQNASGSLYVLVPRAADIASRHAAAHALALR
jgi:membrane-bound lytic murein transglycosylase A